MKDCLQKHMWGDVPQAINVLIDDVARSHGTLRSSAVSCYVRSDDAALLTQAVAAVTELRSIAPDRKSTRLNSSHVAISYAVFCLKKKKPNTFCPDSRVRAVRHNPLTPAHVVARLRSCSGWCAQPLHHLAYFLPSQLYVPSSLA